MPRSAGNEPALSGEVFAGHRNSKRGISYEKAHYSNKILRRFASQDDERICNPFVKSEFDGKVGTKNRPTYVGRW